MWGAFITTLSALLFWTMLLFSFPTILSHSVDSPTPNHHNGNHYRRRLHPPPHHPRPHKRLSPPPPPPPPAWFYFYSPPPPSPPCAPHDAGQPLHASPPPHLHSKNRRHGHHQEPLP
ncbi:hypothetical protein CsatB_008680 [Cannabis sativa]|uniref:extensin-like n=1 Tax=Cannabis sativa TaxID=3483 RepID=UPI0029CA593F|nr:extensin-like [Cannabis sativa]